MLILLKFKEMKKLLFLILVVVSSCKAQKKDTLNLVTATPIFSAKPVPVDTEVVLMSFYELQQKITNLEMLAIKNGWIVQSKYGILNAKDVEQFKGLTDTQLSAIYTVNLLRRFAESLKISVLGTKAVLIKNIKEKVISIK
jgi:hypothetical protein